MSKNIIEGNWNEIKDQIKTKWGKLTDDEVETLKVNLDQFARKIKKAYGRTSVQAESEYVDFKSFFQAIK